MADFYEIHRNVPIREGRGGGKGLSGAIRRMNYGDCVIVPIALQGSVHACARSVGAKVRTRSNVDGTTLTIWRVDGVPVPGSSAATIQPSTPRPFKSAFETTVEPLGYYFKDSSPYSSKFWCAGPPPDSPDYVDPSSSPVVTAGRPKNPRPTPLPTTPKPDGSAFS